MSEPKKERLLIAASQTVAGKLTGILAAAGIEPDGIVSTAEEAMAACAEQGALLLTTYSLPDMSGAELADKLGDWCDVLIIVPQDYAGTVPENVLTLRNPISPDALVQSVRTMAHCRVRLGVWRAKAEKLARTLEERKVIDRAKGRLMDALHLTEAQAHHYIQKKSMDSGCRIVDVAKEILEAEQITAE